MAADGTHEDLMNTIGARINTVLEPLMSGTTIVYDNQEFPAATTDPWIRATVLHGDNFQADIGADNKRIRRQGTIVFQLFSSLGIGTKAINALVAHVETVFRTQKVDKITYRTPSVKTIGRSGKHYQINVTCPFWVDVF